MRKQPRPISDPPANLRQRQRADGSWRIWWEPQGPAARELGFKPVELDPDRLTWSTRRATDLNRTLREAQKPRPRPKSGTGRTMQSLIDAYQQSPKWLLPRDQGGLALATKRSYQGEFNRIARKWGTALVIDFDAEVVMEWLEALSREISPHTAKAVQRVLSVLFTYARKRGWRSDNPCLDVELHTPKPRRMLTGWAGIDALLDAASDSPLPGLQTAIALAAFQGQRSTDILQAKLADFIEVEVDPKGAAWAARQSALKDWTEVAPGTALDEAVRFARQRGLVDPETGGSFGLWLMLRSKRQNLGGMLLHPEVTPKLTALAGSARPGQTYLIARPKSDTPFDVTTFGGFYRQARAKAAQIDPTLAGLQFRDLRRTFATLARAGGATTRDVGDGLGNNAWRDPNISGTYMPDTFDTASTAVMALRRPKAPRKRNTG